MSAGSKKLTSAGIGLGMIAGVAIPAAGQSIVAFCIKVGSIALITTYAIYRQANLDRDNKSEPTPD